MCSLFLMPRLQNTAVFIYSRIVLTVRFQQCGLVNEITAETLDEESWVLIFSRIGSTSYSFARKGLCDLMLISNISLNGALMFLNLFFVENQICWPRFKEMRIRKTRMFINVRKGTVCWLASF